ncbi:MAG TPA: MmgE/PrpD family protein [Burkholderiales bacterium]|nr:MmgE/PrpD family protein [Burkholderiales bacterium]
MGFALELARRITGLRYEDLPPEAVHWAKIGVLDTVGVTLAGSADPSATLVARVISSGGPSLVLGTGNRVGPLDAALVNGTASHALDFDDCNNTLGGHPSAPILPALFALADQTGASGRDFITAYVAGFETECKISLGVNFYQYTRGWHPTTTIGVFGAAAACAKLLGLDAERTATALAIAASLAAGIKSNFGTYVKPLHIGHCARSGLFAALLAREDYTASPVAFEHKQGYFEVFNGAGNYDAGRILPAWGKPFDIVQPGIAIKQYPCCGSTHPAIDAMLALARTHDLKRDAVGRIQSWTHERRLEHTNRPDPQSTKDAKFSVQYCLARALVDRKVTIEHFEGDAYTDPAVRAVMSRIEVAPYTTEQFPAENHFGAEVKVTLHGGTVLSAKVDQPAGRTVEVALPPERLKEKFENCALRVLPADATARVHAAITALETLVDVRAVNDAMESPSPRATVQRAGASLTS